MKIALTSTSETLADPIDVHFGRTRFFILADTETGEGIAHDNEQNLNAAQGAGIQSGETVARLGAEAVITGSVGPKAFRTLQAAGIKIYLVKTVCPGTEALRLFKEGELDELTAPNSAGHVV